MKSKEEITEIVKRNGGRQEGTRVYGEAPSQSWQAVLDEIEAKTVEPEKQTEQVNIHLQFGNVLSWVNKLALEGLELQTGMIRSFKIPQDVVVLAGIVPDTLTMPLMEKWKKMSTFERILMFQNTPQDRIEKRKGRGGKDFNYVKGNFMDQEANIAFLFGMSSKIDGWHLDEKGVACYGSISFILEGLTVTSSGVGIDVQEYSGTDRKPVFCIAEMMKNAHTDMKKKALAAKGFNGDVYRGEV